MVMTATRPLSIEARDITGQKRHRVHRVDPDRTVGELLDRLLPRLDLPTQADDRPLLYGARLQREGRQLHRSERLGDALQEDDELLLAPTIEAGAGSAACRS
jgi:hypothetical protein